MVGKVLIEGKADHVNVSLLRVSQLVRSEATPVLYGANSFAFHDRHEQNYNRRVKPTMILADRSLCSFLTRIGNSRKHLRSIKIGATHNAATIVLALRLLKQATKLDSFMISITVMSHLHGNAHRFKAWLPWLQALQKNAKDLEGRKGALEIFQIDPDDADVMKRHPSDRKMHEELMSRLTNALT
jgi:hypothetical protein